MDSLLQDVRYALRLLAKRPGFTLVATLALALGIGANTAIFSVVNAVVLRPLPYEDSDRLVMVWESDPKQKDHSPVAPANFLDWREQSQTFEHLAASRGWSFNLTGGEQPEQIEGAVATASLFSVLRAKPVLGRPYLPEEEQPGSNRVVVLSEVLWRSLFGANPNIVGQQLTLNAEQFTVVGVMSDEMRYPEPAQLWVPPRNLVPEYPLNPKADPTTVRSNHYIRVIGRLKPGVTLAQGQSEMETIARRLEQQYPDSNTDVGVNLVPLSEHVFGSVRPALLVLFGAVGFVLLIACANVANLLFVRAASRQKEMALRTALGAGRMRLVRQLLTEAVLLSLAGGGAGLLLAMWAINPLISLSPESIRNTKEIGIDAQALGFTFLVSLVTGIIFGLIPALQSSKPDLNETLKEGGRGSVASAGRNRVRSLMVVSEIALSLVLLIGAGLMIKSFLRLERVDPGFSPENVLAMTLSLPQTSYPDGRRQAAFFKESLERIRALPGVEAAGAITRLPLSGGNSSRDFSIEGAPAPGRSTVANFRVISPDYFLAMRIPVVRGRQFTEMDNQDAAGVVIISEEMARRFWPDADPVGERLRVNIPGHSGPREIIGVVGDVRHFGLDVETQPEMYVPCFQSPWPSMTLVVRSAPEASNIAAAVRNEIWAVDRNQPVSAVITLQQLLSASTSARRFSMTLLSLFAALALVLAAVGIYGVMAYSVAQRTHEIGIRMALGARPGDILKLVVGHGLKLVFAGVVIGLAGAFALTRLMSSLLFGVSASDPPTFIFISLLLSAVALLASYIPARRAMRVDPGVALRYE